MPSMKEPAPARPRRRIQVRRSGVHGRGVFAEVAIAQGEIILEYAGEVIDWDEALRRHPRDASDPNHTFYFHLEDGRVADRGTHADLLERSPAYAHLVNAYEVAAEHELVGDTE